MLLVKADNILLAPHVTLTLTQEFYSHAVVKVKEPDSCKYAIHIVFVNRFVKLDAETNTCWIISFNFSISFSATIFIISEQTSELM